MHAAAIRGADAIVEFLVKNGAQVDVGDMSGETPRIMAKGISPRPSRAGLYGNYKSTASLLVELGATPMTAEEIEDFMKRAEAIPNLQRYTLPDNQSSSGEANSENVKENKPRRRTQPVCFRSRPDLRLPAEVSPRCLSPSPRQHRSETSIPIR